ncbi:DUF397 domain-containing protein [Streptomyces sp. 7N604]|uniref:DUF397 domain-containing protein n=1 Tax=Streptomyces sp. 7N604 TaxID=3457415 RepID=UPI003FD35CC4
MGAAGRGARRGRRSPVCRARAGRQTPQVGSELYALDLSGVEWHSAPSGADERVEIAYLPGGAVAMRSTAAPETVLRYTEAEWRAFALGARDGEFDLEPGSHNGGAPTE